MKGSEGIYAWVVVLAMMFVVIFLWIIFGEIIAGHMIPWAEDEFTELNMTAEIATLENLENYWNYWPLLLAGGLTVYGIASSARRSPGESTYYG